MWTIKLKDKYLKIVIKGNGWKDCLFEFVSIERYKEVYLFKDYLPAAQLKSKFLNSELLSCDKFYDKIIDNLTNNKKSEYVDSLLENIKKFEEKVDSLKKLNIKLMDMYKNTHNNNPRLVNGEDIKS